MHFNPRAPRGARPAASASPSRRRHFNPRAPRGARLLASISHAIKSNFNPRAPRGARPTATPATRPRAAFQSTRPCGARPTPIPLCLRTTSFQSTRPCGARQAVQRRHEHDISISIHAPVWGATAAEVSQCGCGRISIHAPVWGATRSISISAQGFSNFNPRARVGRDPPRRRHACAPCNFNPRARVGRDLRHYVLRIIRFISIHAPVWGATVRLHKFAELDAISIHAPVWGATKRAEAIVTHAKISIHAPVWGATTFQTAYSGDTTNFNPRARVGRDRPWCRRSSRANNFNPRARVGRDVVEERPQLVERQFQSTRPCGARPLTAAPCKPMGIISIHAPVWGATWQID